MTGYGRACKTLHGREITVELRSVNNRFLDCSVRLPRAFSYAEDAIKQLVKDAVQRGKVDVFVSVNAAGAEEATVSLNRPVLEGYLRAMRTMVADYGVQDDISASALSALPDIFVVEKPEEDEKQNLADLTAGPQHAVCRPDAAGLPHRGDPHSAPPGHRAGAAAHGRLLRHGSGRKAGGPDARRCRKFEDHNTGRSAHRRGDLEGENDMRIGHGYDVHRLVPGRKLILGGVEIPFERGLDGHSDADVLTHALMDALLGAACLGDIGLLFPDNDPQYKGISSLLLLEEVVRRVHAAGFAVGNADITVLCQRPKLRPHIPAMQERLRALLGTETVNVKATTEEGLGFTGSGEGIACHAVCLLEERA